ncbi:MAG: TlpA family protein disulfide reductase [Fibrobacterota bacterium]|nr:TlpA family protein disulfide reductase [Fibrobacterota bacterium]QQS05226.1 MAG: TlpA family protein disulfide reductase [Fibrobacterota bacterium]
MRVLSMISVALLASACIAEKPAPVAAPKAPAPSLAAPVAPVGPSLAVPAPPAKATKIDFTIPLQPIKQKDLSFSMLKNRWSLLFYFSPTCGHCMHTFPAIREIRTKYEKKGLAVAAIATGTASPEDIATFDSELKLDVMAFQDVTKKFSQEYGTGSVPLILLVSPDASFKMWNSSDSATQVEINKSIRSALKLK